MMERDELGLTAQENLQIEALKAGATEDEASLMGKLPRVRRGEQVEGEEFEEGASGTPRGSVAQRGSQGVSGASSEDDVHRIDRDEVRGVHLMQRDPIVEGSLSDVIRPVEQAEQLSSLVGDGFQNKSQEVLKRKASDLALIKSAIDPLLDPQEAYRTSLAELRASPNMDEVFNGWQQEYITKAKESVLEFSVAQINTGEIDTEEAAELIAAAEDIEQVYEGKAGKERLLIDAYAEADFDDFMADSEAATNYAWGVLQEYTEDRNWIQWGASIGGLLVPDFIKDAHDLVDGKLFETKQDILNMATNYQALPPASRPEAFDEIWERAVPAYERNHIKLAGLLHLLHSDAPESEWNLMAGLDAADIGLTAWQPISWAANVIRGMSSHTRAIKKMRNIDAKDRAAQINMLTESPGSDNPAAVMAGERVDAAASRSPHRIEDMLVGIDSTDGVAFRVKTLKDEAMRGIADTVRRDVEAPMAAVKEEGFFVDVTALNAQEKQKAVGDVARRLREQAEDAGLAYEEVGPVSMSERGFQFRYKLAGEDRTEDVRFVLDDVGVPEGLNLDFVRSKILNNAISNRLLSPEIRLSHISPDLVNATTLGGMQASRIKKELTGIARSLDKGMTKKERGRVNDLLLTGDEEGRVFSYNQLRNEGVEMRTAGGARKFTDKEVENYYKKVFFNEQLWTLRNELIRRVLEFLGYKGISYRAGDETKQFIGAPARSMSSVKLDTDDIVLAPQLTDSGYTSARSINLSQLSEDGFRAVRLLEPYHIGGKKVSWAFIRDEGAEGAARINNLPEEVLHRQLGYVPRIYKPGYYYVKDILSGKTLRAFESRANAEKWSAAERARYMRMTPEEREAAGITQDINPQVFRDRELNKQEALIEDANQYGGLYTGARKREPLLLNEGEQRPERMGWADSTQRYVDSLSEAMPLTEFRLAMKQRYDKLVDELAKAEGKPYGRDPTEHWTKGKHTLNDNQTNSALDAMRDYLVRQFQTYSKEEKSYHAFMMGMAESMSGKHPKMERMLIAAAHATDPLRAWATASFHTHLGWFNPRQLYIQAQNAALAIAAHPLDAIPSINKAAAMQMFLRVPDNDLPTVINHFGKIPGVNSQQMIEDIRAFRRSGMESSIVRNADIQATIQGLGPGTWNSFRQLSKKGLMFYEQGELFSRIVAWNIARRRWERANPGKAFDDDAVKWTTSETFRLHLNLQKENAASWQQSVLRTPTQFFQVQAKLYEKMVPGLLFQRTAGGWTPGEAYRVLAGQLVMYGALGVPIAEEVMNRVATMTGKSISEVQEENPMLAELALDGAIGAMFEMMGFDNQFGGDTASLIGGANDNIIAGMIEATQQLVTGSYGNDAVGEIMFGPSLNMLRRTGDFVIDTTQAMMAVWHVPSAENGMAALQRSVDSFASITSSWSNAQKGWYLYKHGEMYSRAGDMILGPHDTQGMNFRTMLARAWGMPTDLEVAHYSISQTNRDMQQRVTNAKSSLKRAMRQYYLDGNMEGFMGAKYGIVGGDGDFSLFTPMEKQDIFDSVMRDISNPQSQLDRELQKNMHLHVRSGGRHPNELVKSQIFQSREQQENN